MIPSTLWRRPTSAQCATLALACAPLLYFFAATRGAIVLYPDDGLTLNLPLRIVAADMLRGGHLPLWNPYYYGGMPLFATAQGGLLFPLNWFFLLLSPQAAMNLAVLGAYALAGVGAYLYARRGGASVTGALVTGLVWQWSGFLVAQLGHTNVVHTASLLPWVLWSIDVSAQRRRRTDAALIAVLVALQVFAGHQQTLAYALLLAAAYAAYMAARATEAAWRRSYVIALSMLLLGVMLAAVQILPTYELMRNSLRAGTTYDFFSSFSMPPVFLLTYFAPYVVGGGDGAFFSAPYTGAAFYGEYIGYVGVTALALAILAPLIRRDALTRFWTLAALVALALALGRFWPFDLYRVIYYVPVLNLFRVPARHLMEVDFALAVLAGRAVTALEVAPRPAKHTALVFLVGVSVFILVCLSVTAWRPAGFQPGHPVLKVSLLRAPELFLPLIVAGASMWALWRFARGARAGRALLLFVVIADLCLWGQFSGWRRSSPGSEHAVWRTPEAVGFLRAREPDQTVRSRILTVNARFHPGATQTLVPAGAEQFVLEAQPNTYMLHGIQNAAGSDGFGLSRYSRLTGGMKLWGDLATPEQALGTSRAFDLLNTRYLIALSPPAVPVDPQPSTEPTPPPTMEIGGAAFGVDDIKAPHLEGETFKFKFPPLAATRIALLTSLGWSADVSQGATVGTLKLQAADGREFSFNLRAGIDTAEWAHEREAALHRIRHQRAPVGTSYPVADPNGNFEGHTYVATFALPERAILIGASIEIARTPQTPQLDLILSRASLIDESTGTTTPWQKTWASRETAVEVAGTEKLTGERWPLVGELREVRVYENTRTLPRAWLATEALSLPDETILKIIQEGRFADGRAWEPRQTALVEGAAPSGLNGASGSGQALVSAYEPQRIEVKTSSDAPAILILGENHYPGWNAFVDGRAVETLRVDYNLRGVALPAGSHLVRFAYRPKSLWLGALISLLAAISLTLWCLQWPREHVRRRSARLQRRKTPRTVGNLEAAGLKQTD